MAAMTSATPPQPTVPATPITISTSPRTRPRPSPSDFTSWLPSTDLESSNFDAQHFLQRVLSNLRRGTTTKDHFDAKAVLEALDTVESALRRRRDAALRDEQAAREDLRNALNALSKRHDLLLQTAQTVSRNVATLGDAGSQGATALRSDLSALRTALTRLTELQDARDFIALLSRLDASELGAVRVSKLLKNSRSLLETEKLALMSPTFDALRARKEIQRYEQELASSIFDCMKTAVDQKSTRLIANCTAAAEQLGVSERFVEVYLRHLFSFDNQGQIAAGSTAFETSKSTTSKAHASPSAPSSSSGVLEPFRAACCESVSFVQNHAGMVVKSFSDARRPLATMLKSIADRKVLVVTESILSTLMESIRASEQRLQNLKLSSSDASLVNDLTNASWRRSSLGRMRSLAISDSKEKWRDHLQDVSDERRRYLIVCADVFTSLNKLKLDLFNACHVAPGISDIREAFTTMKDPYISFIECHLGRFLEIQKTWMDDQLGTAFFDITRIDMHAPRLAPREKSNVDVYHRYRAFYGLVSSSFLDMTRRAIQSTHESICRTVSVFSSVLTNDGKGSMQVVLKAKPGNSKLGTMRKDEKDILKRQFSGYEEDGLVDSMRKCEQNDQEADKEQFQQQLVTEPRDGVCSSGEMKAFVRELLGNLVMNYLANVETLLQAATHLLPVCEADAKMAQLWMSGASPLTAYTQAIEILAKSNELVDEFVMCLNNTNPQSSSFDLAGIGLDDDVNGEEATVVSKKSLIQLVPLEIRQVLHEELASGLQDLSAEAQIGVQAAISSLRARLFAMLTTKQATGVYTIKEESDEKAISSALGGLGGVIGFDDLAEVSVGAEPSEAFISASTFVEQQLQSVVSSMSGENKEFVISEMCAVTREAVLDCWCHIDGVVCTSGALQMMEDGKTMARVFREHVAAANMLKFLPVVGQMYLEAPEDLWCYVDSPALSTIDAGIICRLLNKREDFDSAQVTKVIQFLGTA